MTNLEPTERTRLRRIPDRGSYDRSVIHAILDEGLVGHLAFAVDGKPWAVPMVYGRIDDTVYVHGSAANHALRSSAGDGPGVDVPGADVPDADVPDADVPDADVEVCFEVTLVDALVLARSAFHHSMNYRSVMIFGSARRVDDLDEKRRALTAVVDHVVPGRSADVRPPTTPELRTTLVLALELREASAKIRTGGPSDEPEDLALPVWAGIVPLTVEPGVPVADEHTSPTSAVPGYATDYRRPDWPA